MTQRVIGGVLGVLLTCGCGDSSDDSCYGPDKNLATAYQDGAVGCACKPGSAGVCRQGVALVCEGQRWHAVEDGPCFPGPGEACGDGFCSQSAFCEQDGADAGQMCVSKRVAGEPCGEPKECASTACVAGSCQ